jgi:hypothetical protein
MAPRDGHVLGEALAPLSAASKPNPKRAATDKPKLLKSSKTPEEYFHKQKEDKPN